MTPQIQAWVKKAKEKYLNFPAFILEIGSLDINGGVRHFFTDAKKYIGIDMQVGRGVDIVLNAHDIKDRFEKSSFDIVICLETLEHDNGFWITLANINYVLKEGGFFLCSTPTLGFPYHPYPKDYWRFTKDAYKEVIFKGYKILEMVEVKDEVGYPGICAIGQKTS